jgi:mannose-6-phosphate isomerase-like protein (cupin superfamily)
MPEKVGDTVERPWGTYTILVDDPMTKVKKLLVKPGQRLSLQSHKHRDEHWVVVSGTAQVTLDDTTTSHSYGEHIYVKRGTRHRIACPGSENVEIIEVQVGDSFAEDDITRYSDDYGRADSSS